MYIVYVLAVGSNLFQQLLIYQLWYFVIAWNIIMKINTLNDSTRSNISTGHVHSWLFSNSLYLPT